MMNLAPFIILCIIACLGTLGNIFIIGAVCLQKKLRVRSNVFVVNLALADLIITGYIMPIGLTTSQYQVEPFSSTVCELNAFFLIMSLGVSTQTLMLIAVERYFHICNANWYNRVFSRNIMAFLVVCTWIYSGIWSMQGWTGWTEYKYQSNLYVCLFSAGTSLSYNICLAVFGMILPMVVISVCYYKIFRVVKQSRLNLRKEELTAKHRNDPAFGALIKQRKKKMQREHRFIFTLFTIVVLFILFWLPTAIVLPLTPVLRNAIPRLLYQIVVWLSFTNSGINSIVYGAMNKNFRSGYEALFRKIFCCCFRGTSCKPLISMTSSHEESGTTNQSKVPSPETSFNQEQSEKKKTVCDKPNDKSHTQISHYELTRRKNRSNSSECESSVSSATVSTRIQEDTNPIDSRDTTGILANNNNNSSNGFNKFVFVSKV